MADFIISSTDCSTNVIADGTYDVIWEDLFETRTDGNGTKHRNIYNHKIRGKFDMFFPTLGEYETFLGLMETNRSSGGTVPVTITCNNLPENSANKTGNCFLDVRPKRAKNDMNEDVMKRMTVTIEEA